MIASPPERAPKRAAGGSAASGYAAKLAKLREALRGPPAGQAPAVGLAESTSNLFRDRARRRPRIDLSHFDEVVRVDPRARCVEAEGMTTFVDLADATLREGTMPAVVPQLKSITLGGAVAGVGIEATSFRHGLVHDTIVAMDVLTGDGQIVTCAPDNEHRDLFFGFPNSYGTLGYALKLTARTLPVAPFVRVDHARHTDAETFFRALAAACASDEVDFVDGVAFDRGDLVLSCARFVSKAPYTSDYTFERIYYRSLRERASDFLTTRDYLWRWDTDWFWCSKNVGAQNPLLRRLYGRSRLNSITYQKIMRWNARVGATRLVNRLRGVHGESVIQDVDIPLHRAAEFLDFLLREIGIVPVWICPLREPGAGQAFPLYPLDGAALYVNFGFWDVVESRVAHEAGHYNRQVEHEVARLGGIKSLYSDSFYTPEEFAEAYRLPAYESLKARYDPGHRLLGLYEKCVLRA